jgi:tetratricopeptide (TPR) repeat protein
MTSMAALFVLIAFGCYLSARRVGVSVLMRRWLIALAVVSWLLGVLCKETALALPAVVVLFELLLGVLCKETALALPAVVVLFELVFHGGEWREMTRAALKTSSGRRRVAATVMILGVLVGAAAWHYVPWATLGSLDPMPKRDFGWHERVLTQPRAQLFYVSLLVWPAPSRLNLDHDFVVSRSLLEPPSTLPALLAVSAAVLGAALLAKRRPRLGFPLLAYFVWHAIESGPVNLELVFEHRMYLPMTMLALFAVAALADAKARVRGPAWIGFAVAALALGTATYQRNLVWSDQITFQYDCATKSPNKFRPQYNLGTELGKLGRHEEAERAFRRAIVLDSEHSETHNQLGTIHFFRGDLDGASAYYRRAVELDPLNAEALYNTALVAERLGDLETALLYYQRFVKIAHGYPWLAGVSQQVRSGLPALAAEVEAQQADKALPSIDSHSSGENSR